MPADLARNGSRVGVRIRLRDRVRVRVRVRVDRAPGPLGKVGEGATEREGQ